MMRRRYGRAHRIPTLDSSEPLGPTSWIRPRRNVIEPPEPVIVEPDVEEAERWSALRNAIVVQERNNPCHRL